MFKFSWNSLLKRWKTSYATSYLTTKQLTVFLEWEGRLPCQMNSFSGSYLIQAAKQALLRLQCLLFSSSLQILSEDFLFKFLMKNLSLNEHEAAFVFLFEKSFQKGHWPFGPAYTTGRSKAGFLMQHTVPFKFHSCFHWSVFKGHRSYVMAYLLAASQDTWYLSFCSNAESQT